MALTGSAMRTTGFTGYVPVTYQYTFLYCPFFFRHSSQHTPVGCEWMLHWVCPSQSLYLGVLQYSLYLGSELPDGSPLQCISEISGQHISCWVVFYLQVSHCDIIFNKKIWCVCDFSDYHLMACYCYGDIGTVVFLLHNRLFHIKILHFNKVSWP